MNVLGFDTATPASAVALRLHDGTTLRDRDDPGAGERPGHTTRLLALAAQLLAEARLSWNALDLIAVGVGPGTFTGLRIGVATARGLAQSLAVELVGVSTPRVLATAAVCARARAAGYVPNPRARTHTQPLRTTSDALADGVEERAGGHGGALAGGDDGALADGLDGVLSVIDARRGEAFVAAYLPAAPSSPGAIGELRELAGARPVGPASFAGLLAELGEARRWLAVGDGALRFEEQLKALGVTLAPNDSPLHRVDAGVLCELGLDTARRGEASAAPEPVLPDYCRRPDAELALEGVER